MLKELKELKQLKELKLLALNWNDLATVKIIDQQIKEIEKSLDRKKGKSL